MKLPSLDAITSRNPRALARVISAAENGAAAARPLLQDLFRASGNAHVIGITGSPGSGKSTMVDELAVMKHQQGERVAVLAVDPSSPYSGGAILGDRIRMNKAAEDGAIYIRSLASRGALGGLSRATLDAIHILDGAGFDTIIIETVGVGQGEVDIMRVADACIVVLVPGMGDAVQTFKAGIIEIADIFAINKSDRDGADLVERDLKLLLSLGAYSETAWRPMIQKTVASTGIGIQSINNALQSHKSWLLSSGDGKRRRTERLREKIRSVVQSSLMSTIEVGFKAELEKSTESCLQRSSDPYSEADALIALLQSKTRS